MTNEPFMDAVVEMVLFLEFSDSQTVDEDAAIRMLEYIAATLQRLGPTERSQFLSYIERRASDAVAEKERQKLESIASNLGLSSE